MIVSLLWIGALLAGIATAGRVRHLRRVDYAWRVAALVVVGLLLAYATMIPGPVGDEALAMMAIALVTVLILAHFGARWSAHRLNHMGQSRWWALLLVVPVFNLLAVIGLCLVPGQSAATSVPDPDGRKV